MWKHRPIKDISRADIRDVIDPIVPVAPIAANRPIAAVSSLFAFALDRELIPASPTSRLKKTPESKRTRLLSADELRELWTALEAVKVVQRADDETTDRRCLRWSRAACK